MSGEPTAADDLSSSPSGRRNIFYAFSPVPRPNDILSATEDKTSNSNSKHRQSKSISCYIYPNEAACYLEIFKQYNIDDFIDGPTAVTLFSTSKLPNEELAKIWALSDIDHDFKLNQSEFCIAMHLIIKRLNGEELPDSITMVPQNPPVGSVSQNLQKQPPTNSVNYSESDKDAINTIMYGTNIMKSRSQGSIQINTAPEVNATTKNPQTEKQSNPTLPQRPSPMQFLNEFERLDWLDFHPSYQSNLGGKIPYRDFPLATGSNYLEYPFITDYDTFPELSMCDNVYDYSNNKSWISLLTNDIRRLSIQLKKMQLSDAIIGDKISSREQQASIIESQYETNQMVLKKYLTELEKKQQHFRQLRADISKLINELKIKKTELDDPAYDPTILREHKKRLQTEYIKLQAKSDVERMDPLTLVAALKDLQNQVFEALKMQGGQFQVGSMGQERKQEEMRGESSSEAEPETATGTKSLGSVRPGSTVDHTSNCEG